MDFCNRHATLVLMRAHPWFHNCIVAALFPIFLGPGAVLAQAVDMDALFSQLSEADERAASRLERQIWREWSKSGSSAMDLLLQRGRDAMSVGETGAAIEHFTALIDHAPDFAEGWNARATAYFQAGLYGPSVADIAQVLRLNPRHFGALTGFARILEETGKIDQALQVYEAALAIHPHLEGVREAVERLQQDAAGQEL